LAAGMIQQFCPLAGKVVTSIWRNVELAQEVRAVAASVIVDAQDHVRCRCQPGWGVWYDHDN
jgi:hypothetical protein